VRELRACDECAAKVAALERHREPPSVDERIVWSVIRAVA
jgi:hypothetical protein